MKRINIILSGILLMQLQNPVLGMEMKITPVGALLPIPKVVLSIDNKTENNFILMYNNSKLKIKATSKIKKEIPQKQIFLAKGTDYYKTILDFIDTLSGKEYKLDIRIIKSKVEKQLEIGVILYQKENEIIRDRLTITEKDVDITKQDSYLIKLTLEGINLGKSELEIFPSIQ